MAESNAGVTLGVDDRLSTFPFCWRMSGFGAGAEIEPAKNPLPLMLSWQWLCLALSEMTHSAILSLLDWWIYGGPPFSTWWVRAWAPHLLRHKA